MRARPTTRRILAAATATTIGAVGSTALATEFTRALLQASSLGADPWRAAVGALLGDLRFFTILTNAFVAALMVVAATRLWRRREPPSAALFRAATVYMIVTGAVYELLLRRLWSPQGLRFALDLVFHDVQPIAMLLFWLLFAPKRDLRWSNLPWIVAYPALYFAVTLIAGARGAGYPYNFLDAGTLGYPTVTAIGLGFLALFLCLGAVATSIGHAITGDRSPAVSRRP